MEKGRIQAEGRQTALRALANREITAEELAVFGEEKVEKHIDEENIEQAEYWMAMQTTARIWITAQAPSTKRLEHADYEVCTIDYEDHAGQDQQHLFWSARGATAEALTYHMDHVSRQGNIKATLIHPAFWEEIAMEYLTYEGEE